MVSGYQVEEDTDDREINTKVTLKLLRKNKTNYPQCHRIAFDVMTVQLRLLCLAREESRIAVAMSTVVVSDALH